MKPVTIHLDNDVYNLVIIIPNSKLIELWIGNHYSGGCIANFTYNEFCKANIFDLAEKAFKHFSSWKEVQNSFLENYNEILNAIPKKYK